MRFRFLHCADIHLGYRQYNESFRADDFARAFGEIIGCAIKERVAFVLIAGDLFHKRAIDASTLDDAYKQLERLQQASIPCVAIEGNHEMAYYGEEGSWLGFLRRRGLITLLQVRFADGAALLDPAANGRGAFVDPLPGVRIYGLGFKGAGAPKAVELCALALEARPPEATAGIEYTIFAAHTGVLGELAGDTSSPTLPQWLPMRPFTDYIALGHIHKPFVYNDWIFNPGSLETCAVNEWAWSERGALLVDVDTDALPGPQRTQITKLRPRRRFFQHIPIKTDTHLTPDALDADYTATLEQRLRDIGGRAQFDDHTRPVVEVQVSGILNFDPSLLNLDEMETRARTTFDAAHVLVKNFTSRREVGPPGTGGADETTLSRDEIEKRALMGLLEDDHRFAAHSDAWADAAIALKQMALVPDSPEQIATELATRVAAINASADSTASAALPS